MDRLRGPPVLKAGNKQQTDPVRFSDGISNKKGMTMNLKNKKGKRLTSTLMAVLMSVSTTLTPVNIMASELETSSAAVESTLEETTAETQVQTVSETAVSKTQEQTTSETAASEAQTSASEMQPVPETTEEVCTEEVQTSGEGAEETSANETRGPDDEETAETAQIETEVETMAESEAESTSEIETEGSTEVEKADPFAALDPSAGFTEEALAAIDFSSKRLLIAADPAVIIDPEHVLSSYAGVYLMQYETESQAKYAYAYYYGKSEFVDVDTVISVADGDNSANAAAPMAANENPIAELHEAVAGNPVKAAGAVAVIDTGVNGVANVTESVSMIGDNTADENGHGTKMAQLIAEQNPDVSILSIKALGADGTGDVSAVYAAIQYAIDKKVSVINLSMSAVGTAENAALTSIIDAAVEAGIAVVGAAGNKGMDVRFFVPGNIESAYIIGAADENGARITSSNYGSTVDFNVVADSTSEAAAKFSGYYTLNGAVADEKLVFPTDYVKEEKIDYNGPIIKHQISFYNYQGSRDDLVWISEKLMKTEIDDEYITARIGFAEDAQAVSGLDIYVDFMSIDSEHAITDECTVDLTNMIVKIPASYKDSNLTIRWYMPNASYQYCYDTDEKYMISNTPEKFKVAYNAVGGLTLKTAQDYVNGTYKQGRTFTHTADSMNHCYVNYSTDGIKVGDYYTITSGYIASVEEKPGIYTTRGEIASMFGPNALNNITEAGYASTQAFLVHFNSVTRDYDSADVSGWFNTVGGKSEIAPGIIRSDIDNIQYTRTDGTTYYTTEEVSASLGWVFGTCANNEIGGQCPTFEPGGKIICTSKDADGTAYFFYYCRSLRAQWAGGSFSITPVFPKTGYLRIHKTSSDPALTDGNSCYNFTNITYKIYSDSSCTTEVQTLYLDQDGYSQSVELTEGTYYIKETDAVNSGYALDTNVYTVTVTAGTTFDAPQTWSTKDAPLNDPLGIVINKINSDGTTAADLSGAEYTITYYPKQYTSVAEIAADTDPEVKPTVWVIQTKKHSDGSYYASLRDECIVPNSNSAGAVFGKNHTGTYVIPLGTITVEETKAPEGFTKDGAIVSSAKTGATISGTNNVYLFQFVDENSAVYLKSGNALSTSLDDETAVTLTYAELQINGSPKMEKHDFELSKKATMGGTSFEGISFEIYCLDDSVAIGNDTYTKGQTITTVTSDEEGNIDVGMQFPVGHYAVREKAANNYYTMTTDQIHYFDVVEYQGEAFIQYESDTNAVTFMDRVVRGDLSFVKKNSDTDEALAYIPFRITNNTTGETHYILTDANGNFTSATGKTTNTNANDVVLSQYGDKDVIPQSVVDSLAKDAGLWFGMGSEGTMTAANDSYSSFVYGTYTITELKTEATRSMKMYTSTFTIDTDGKVLDLGTVNNVPMRIKTTLVDVNGEHFTEATSTVTLTDHVAYKNLDTDKTYTLTGTLYVKDGDALTEMMTETVDFQPTETSGTQDVTFTFDASELVGKSVVAFEELSVNGEFCAEHKDKDDENQTVVFPDLKTTARDSETDDHVSNADDSITIIDTVEYSGLHVGNEYTITGTLMDQETGKAVLDDDGNEITASKVITATESNGTVEIEFQFAGVSLAGKTIVVFENLDYEGKRYAVHADLNDKNQTIYFPSIKTKATDKNTGLNQVKEDSNVTVVDTVTYTGLQSGKTYTMTGMLMSSAGNAIVSNGRRITASTEFTPTESDGSIDVVFNFDATNGFGGRQYVFYEYLYLDGVRVAAHTDISDTNQIIYIPSIRTTLIDAENGSHSSAADQDITLIDTVRYNGVEIGRKYTVVGTLVDKATGKEILDDAGNKITASNEFVAEKTNGTIDVTFKFSGKCLAGKTTVAFEDMYSEGKKVAVHADLRDEGQTEYFPSVHTTATSNDTKDHVVGANEKVTITDQVALKALKLGTEYTLSGTLMNAKTGKPIMVNGNTITARRTFTADAHEMTIPLTYTLNASELAGTTTVVFENLYSDGALLAAHADLEDDEQTVYIPKIHTTAKDQKTKINHTEADKTATIVDTVSYTNLLPGREYTVSGTLMDKETGKAVLADGKEITASTTFTPEKSEGSVDVIFTFDASVVAPKTVVAFETLTYKKIQIAVHADIEDKDQTVYITTIRTSAKDNVTGINHTEADKEVTITDTVTYKGLEVGREYTVSGTLMNQRTGAKILVNGKPVTASTTFTAEKKEGSVEVVFAFDASALEGTTTVVYEKLYTENKEVAAHTDINDKGQTIYIPKVRTTAIADDTKDHVTEAKKNVTIVDTVSYEGLEVGREYTVKGVFMNKATGETITINGEEVTAESTFTAKAQKGTVDVTFKFDGSALEDTLIVVFETIYTEEKEVGVHAEINDDAQTVYLPKIRTNAEDAVTKINHTEAKPQATIIDTVSYSSLLPGKEYTMTGTLMNKNTKEPILIDGEPITASTTFTAEKSSGSVEVVFTFDASVLEGTTVVAYENLTYKGVEVAIHADITDKDQTVYIPKVRTTAIADDTKDHVTKAQKDVTIVDTVSYEGLEVDREYTVKGVLMNKATGKVITVNGKEVTAESTFTAKAQKGTVDVTFKFDGSALEDTLIVVFETLYTEGKEVGVHAEIEDDAQTVYIPKIQTEAKDAVTEIDHTEALPKAKIVDTVSYSSLLPEKEYTVIGTLMNKETKEPILIDGKEITASTTFTAEKAEGSVEVVFEFDASAIAGTTVVAFESMEYKGVEVAVHADIEDENQTVYIPDVHTTAAATDTKDHVTGAKEEVTITDEVALTGLKVGNEYTVWGVLMDRNTGVEIQVNGERVTDEKTFTADAAEMTITLTYTLDAKTLAGTTTVVFETLYTEGKEVGRHHEIDDEGQTVYIPEIHTTAADQKNGINHTEANEKATIVDTVYYSHLLPGKEYTVHGKLMDKKTGESILIDGKEITASTTFTAENEEGSVDVIFTFDASILAPKTVVAFEYLEYEGIEIAVHEDIDDEDQTVYIPKIHTTAVGEDTQDHIEKAKNEAVIVDTVSYEGLEVGREYTVTGKLMDKETGEPILVNGEEVTAGETFTAETEDGSIDITFTFDSSALAGKSLVAFETLYTEEKEVAVHADIEDEGQTVRIPEIHTTATDKVTGDHDGVVAKETTVLDEVFYKNLIPGKEYTVSGKLMVKETGEPLTVDGKEVTAEKTFVAEEADGSIILEFTFDSSALAGKKIVAFEDITYEGISIGSHEDLTDEDQTISYPEIHTTAVNGTDGSKTMVLGTNVTLVDTVTYKGLTAGKTYVVKGTIMDKAGGQQIGVTAETTFTAEAADGSVEVTFTFDTTQLQGKTLVVFETLYDTQGNPIVDHSDLNDENQTVSVPVQPVIPPVVTGDDSSPMPYVAGLTVALLAAVAIAIMLIRRKNKHKLV